ncbi:polymeric immunoglobulin receptor, partial [Austrofundulus limnaeus]|uniref:polymeric immunoglobulin receptor n=1 Tax=Austrofundulus limnaeus TaxID=52670 RepID=UPI0006B3AC40
SQSDSGLYRCGLGRSSSSASFVGFRLVVADALLKEDKVHHFKKTSGSSLTLGCSFSFSGRRQFFCGGRCDDEILLQTDRVRAENGRYRIDYKVTNGGSFVFVTINQLITSDSGPYRCALDSTNQRGSYRDFTVSVTDETSGGTPRGTYNLLLIVGLTLGVTVVLVSAALLVSCRRRSLEGPRTRRSPHGSNMEELDYVNCTPQDPTYQSLSPATTDQNQIYSTLTGNQ